MKQSTRYLPAGIRQVYALLLLICLAAPLTADNFDAKLLRVIHEGYQPGSTQATLLTGYSNSAYAAAALPPLILAAAGYQSGNKQFYRDALQIAVSQAANLTTVYLLKLTVNRKRPYKSHDWVNTDIRESDASFPSGHSSSSMVLAVFLHLRYHKPLLTTAGYVYAGGMMLTRMRQGVHYPADVATGAALGATAAWLTARFLQKQPSPESLSLCWLPATNRLPVRLSLSLRF